MEKWFSDIVMRMFRLMHDVHDDNFDAWRYRGASPNVFFPDTHGDYLLFLESHRREFFAARSLLADDTSRSLFDELILFRLLGHLHVRLRTNTPEHRRARQTVEQWRVGVAAHASDVYGALANYVVPIDDDALCINCWPGNIAANFIWRQYYFDRDGVWIAPRVGDHALDVGGCFGDTALTFARSVGDRGHVYAFDPMPKHCEIMRENFAMNPALGERITLFDFGLSDRDSKGSEDARMGIDPGASLGDDLPTRTLDSLDLLRVDFVKMDVEGAELMALREGEQSIRAFKPRMALSLYHRDEDFFSIPLWLEALGIGYRLHLDHYSIHREETVLYAV